MPRRNERQERLDALELLRTSEEWGVFCEALQARVNELGMRALRDVNLVTQPTELARVQAEYQVLAGLLQHGPQFCLPTKERGDLYATVDVDTSEDMA